MDRGDTLSDSGRAIDDGLADDYHLLFAPWRQLVRCQGVVLDRLARAALGDGPHRLLG